MQRTIGQFVPLLALDAPQHVVGLSSFSFDAVFVCWMSVSLNHFGAKPKYSTHDSNGYYPDEKSCVWQKTTTRKTKIMNEQATVIASSDTNKAILLAKRNTTGRKPSSSTTAATPTAVLLINEDGSGGSGSGSGGGTEPKFVVERVNSGLKYDLDLDLDYLELQQQPREKEEENNFVEKDQDEKHVILPILIVRYVGRVIRLVLLTIRNALFALVILSIVFTMYDSMYLKMYSKELNDSMLIVDSPTVMTMMQMNGGGDVSQPSSSTISSSGSMGDGTRSSIAPINGIAQPSKYDVTVFMMSRDRLNYVESIPPFLQLMDREFDSVVNPKTGAPVRKQFILFDIESEPPLPIPASLQTFVDSGKLKVIRKSPGSNSRGELTDNDVVDNGHGGDGQVVKTAKKRPFKFSVWESWAFAMNHISSDFLFYFDNCNKPGPTFRFQQYWQKGDNLFFPNDERYYTQNFAAKREDFVRFLNELPRHIIRDKRSFFGGDQLLIWYLNSVKQQAWLVHIEHEELTKYSQWNTHSIAIWRVFLYMNRYSHPNGPGGMGNMRPEFCRDKQPICSYNGIARKFLALWGVYHMIDTAMRFEILFVPVTFIVNLTRSWMLGFSVTAVLNVLFYSLFWMACRWLSSSVYTIVKTGGNANRNLAQQKQQADLV